MTQALQAYTNPIDELAFAEKMGHYIIKSTFFGCTKPEQGPIIAYTCRVKGMDLIQFNETYDIMHDGKIRRKANNALAEFRKRGGKHKWLNMGDDGKEAAIELTDWDGNKQKFTYTIEEARKASLIKKDGAWEKTPGTMLRVRCISKAVMAMTPEIYCGGEDSDEGEDVPALNLVPAQSASVVTAPVEKVLTPNFQPTPTPNAAQRQEAAKIVDAMLGKEAKTEVVIEQPAEVKAEPVKTERPVPAGELPVETVKKLMEAIGDEMAGPALAYMIGLKWLQDGQHLGNLTKTRADMILNGTERFKKAVADAAAKAK